MRKENVTRTPKEVEQIKTFIKNHGFSTIAEFSKAVGMERQNVFPRINGTCDPGVRMLLEWAIILKCDIKELIELFYPKEYENYKNRDKTVIKPIVRNENAKREWNIVGECDDENGNPTTWATEINHLDYGKYCWITFDGKVFNVEVEQYGNFIVLKKCKSLASAKSWVTRNL